MNIESNPIFQRGYEAGLLGRENVARFFLSDTREKYEAGYARGQEERKRNER